MAYATLERELHEQWEQLEPERQQQVVDFARSLALKPPLQGVSGMYLLQFAGTLSDEDAEEMTRAIEEECEQIDWAGWV